MTILNFEQYPQKFNDKKLDVPSIDIVVKMPNFSYSLRQSSELSQTGDALRDTSTMKSWRGVVSDLPIDAARDANEIEMLEARENWSVYRLADGTTLRIKPVMIAVFRAEGQQGPAGEPVYNMKSTIITDVRVPISSNKPN